MPQKLGKGGHGQQNYVPAGYGEASGTYGDNPTGSNKFVKFEKPVGEQPFSKNNERYYIRMNGEWYIIKGENLEKFKKLNPEIKKIYSEQEKKEFENKKYLTEKKEKKQYVKNLEENIKSKVSKRCRVNFEGFDETGCKLMEESFNAIYNDFPEIGNYLFELGTQSGLNKEIDLEKNKRFEEFKKNITSEQIEEHRQKLINWNKNVDPSKFTDEYVKSVLIRINQPSKTRKVLTGRTQGAYIPTGSGKGEVQFLNTVGKKSYEKKVLSNFDTNWWSSKNPNSVMTHELGHAVDYMIFDLEKDSYGDRFREQIRNLYSQENADIRMRETKSKWEKTNSKNYALSKYGMSNLKEFIAESFAAYYGGDNNPIANKVISIMKEAYKSKLDEIKKRGKGATING